MMKFAALFTVLGMISLLSFRLIGAYVDSQGYLHEPFGLLPLGYLLIFVGILLTFLGTLRAYSHASG